MSLVLVHGANFSSMYWQYCMRYLRHATLALDWLEQSESLDEQLSFDLLAQAALREMDAAGVDSATLVGHSIGGHIIRAMAELAPQRIRRLIFVAAPVFLEGERWLDTVIPAGQELLKQWHAEGRRSYQMPAEFVPVFCNDMNERLTGVTVENLRPGSVPLFFESIPQMTNAASIPCAYIKLLGDEVLTPAAQDGFIAKLPGCRVVTLDAGHMAMISRPKEFAEILNALAE